MLFLDISDRLAFHASSVILNGKAILFAGDGGTGKSTIAGMLEEAGYRVPGDEVAFVTLGKQGEWYLGGTIKKINGEYELFETDGPARVEAIVFLRGHRDTGYIIDPCRPARAVKETFHLLFCDRQSDPLFLLDAFRWTSSIFRQSRAYFLEFTKSIDFFPELINLINGDKL